MRLLAVICLVAACGNDTGLLLMVKGSTGVASVEVFLPDSVDDSSIGMPPAKTTPIDGAVFSVIDSVKATVSGETHILLQPGDLTDVPGLLVLAYDGNGQPIADAVVRNADGSPIHLPKYTATELQITLEPTAYVKPTKVKDQTGARIARWSATSPDGDLAGGCIAVLGDDGNAFFDTKDDLDCDGLQPECNDRVYDFVDTSATPPTGACVSRDFRMPDTQQACRIGQTVACTDGVGTCGPLANNTAPPVCVPEALCRSCPNSDSTSGTSGLDPACELDALMNGDDVPVVDCDLDALVSASAMVPCADNLPAFDFSMYAGAGWGCVHIAGFIDNVGRLGPGQTTPGTLLFGVDPNSLGYTLSASCPTETAPAVQFTMAAVSQQPTPIPIDTTADAMLVFGAKSPTAAGPFAELAVPFHLHFHAVQQCSTTTVTATCKLVTLHGGDGTNDEMWKGCAGAP